MGVIFSSRTTRRKPVKDHDAPKRKATKGAKYAEESKKPGHPIDKELNGTKRQIPKTSKSRVSPSPPSSPDPQEPVDKERSNVKDVPKPKDVSKSGSSTSRFLDLFRSKDPPKPKDVPKPKELPQPKEDTKPNEDLNPKEASTVEQPTAEEEPLKPTEQSGQEETSNTLKPEKQGHSSEAVEPQKDVNQSSAKDSLLRQKTPPKAEQNSQPDVSQHRTSPTQAEGVQSRPTEPPKNDVSILLDPTETSLLPKDFNKSKFDQINITVFRN